MLSHISDTRDDFGRYLYENYHAQGHASKRLFVFRNEITDYVPGRGNGAWMKQPGALPTKASSVDSSLIVDWASRARDEVDVFFVQLT